MMKSLGVKGLLSLPRSSVFPDPTSGRSGRLFVSQMLHELGLGFEDLTGLKATLMESLDILDLCKSAEQRQQHHEMMNYDAYDKIW